VFCLDVQRASFLGCDCSSRTDVLEFTEAKFLHHMLLRRGRFAINFIIIICSNGQAINYRTLEIKYSAYSAVNNITSSNDNIKTTNFCNFAQSSTFYMGSGN
jgi:hypothetical protein